MIYDQLSNVERYRGLYKGLDVLIDGLGEHDPAQLPVGRNDICGDKVYANVMEPTTRPLSEAHYETHHRYMDLQIDVEGREAFKVSQGATTEVQAYDEGDDYELCDAGGSVDGNLDEGRFAIFVIGEPHMPTLQFPGDGAKQVRKICFKILGDQFWD